jgi:hypothetical protein
MITGKDLDEVFNIDFMRELKAASYFDGKKTYRQLPKSCREYLDFNIVRLQTTNLLQWFLENISAEHRKSNAVKYAKKLIKRI